MHIAIAARYYHATRDTTCRGKFPFINKCVPSSLRGFGRLCHGLSQWHLRGTATVIGQNTFVSYLRELGSLRQAMALTSIYTPQRIYCKRLDDTPWGRDFVLTKLPNQSSRCELDLAPARRLLKNRFIQLSTIVIYTLILPRLSSPSTSKFPGFCSNSRNGGR